MNTLHRIPAADPVLEAESFWWQPLAVVGLKVVVVFVILNRPRLVLSRPLDS